MSDWSSHEHGALSNFLATPGPLRGGFERFVREWALEHKAACAAAMASVPRNPELAADHAAKAQLLDEFWAVLTERLLNLDVPSEEPTLRGVEE